METATSRLIVKSEQILLSPDNMTVVCGLLDQYPLHTHRHKYTDIHRLRSRL